jgi:hypothetical protein
MSGKTSPISQEEVDKDLLDILIEKHQSNQKLLDKHQRNKHTSSERALICGALLAFCFSAVIQLLSLPTYSFALQIASACFAVAIPLLSIAFMFENWQRLYNGYRYFSPKYPFFIFFLFVFLLAVATSSVGIGAIFFHFDWKIGLLFTIITMFILIVHTQWRQKIDKIRSAE